MSSSEELKKARTYMKGRFTRARNSLIGATEKEASQVAVKSYYNQFKEVWGELQQRHEAYVMSLETDTETEWIENVTEEFEDTNLLVDEYCEKLSKADVKEEVKAAVETAISRLKGLEVQRKQESIRFDGVCTQLETLLSVTEDQARNSVDAVKEFASRLQVSKDKLDALCNQFVEISIREGKDVAETVDDMILRTERQFNKLLGEARIFQSKYSLAKESAKDVLNSKPQHEKGGIRLEKVKFNVFDGDMRRYPCFRQEFKCHIKPHYSDEEEAFVLKSYLAPGIRDDVGMLGEDAKEIWERLDRKYGDEGKLVDAIMTDVKRIPLCCDDNPQGILFMITTIERAYRDLSYLSMQQEMSNSTIVSFIEQRLPNTIESEWLKMVTGANRLAVGRDKFPSLYKLLLDHKERIEYKFSDMRNSENPHARVLTSDASSVKKPWCWLHPHLNDHPIWRCKGFMSKGVQERVSLVHRYKACIACLEQGHCREKCQKGFRCREVNCGKNHHTLLHVADEAAFSFHGCDEGFKETGTLLLLQELTTICAGQRNRKLVANCLWDSGSTLSFITFDMAKRLNLKGSKVNLKVTKIGGVTDEIMSFRYNLALLSDSNKVISIPVLGLEKISTKTQALKVDTILEQFTGVNHNEIRRPKSGDVDILLGMDVAGLHPVRIAAENNLLLLRNEFGLVVGGSHPSINEYTQRVVQHAHTYVSLIEFEDSEQLGVSCSPKCGSCKCGRCHPGGANMTLQEEEEYKMIVDGLKYDSEEGRWTAHYPWKRDPSELPNNYAAAIGALKSLEKGLKRNQQLADLYRSQIQDMLDRKACRLLCQEEINAYDGPTYYIAHDGVYKPESKSTPLRIVFNLSASFNGHVLNEYYAKGPSMLNDLLGLLLRFCQEKFAAVGDISKMYHAIKIPIQDQMTHRFLWRDLKEDEKPQTYAVTVVNFGDRPAGCIAIAALKKTAEMAQEEQCCKQDNTEQFIYG